MVLKMNFLSKGLGTQTNARGMKYLTIDPEEAGQA